MEIEKASQLSSKQIQRCRFLFQFLDPYELEEISVSTVVNHLSLIDKRISQNWLTQLLKEEGLKLAPMIKLTDFIVIFKAIKRKDFEKRGNDENILMIQG